MKIKHLLKKADFNSVLAGGKKLRGEKIEFYIQKSQNTKDACVGVIISKKIEPTAVRRNLLKRIVYGHYRDLQEDIKPEIKTIIKFYKKLPKLTRKELSIAIREEISKLLNEGGAIK